MAQKRLVFRNYVQQVLFEVELMGQISDGKWENVKPENHWRYWLHTNIDYDETGENIGRNFYAPKDNYNFNATDLLDVVGDRMIRAANLAFMGYSIDVIDQLYDVNFSMPLMCEIRTIVEFDGNESQSQLIEKAKQQAIEKAEHSVKNDLFINRYFTMLKHFGSLENFNHEANSGPYDMTFLRRELKDMKSIVKTRTVVREAV